MDQSSSHASYLAAMRQTAGATAFGAALLLFFGFYYLAEPSRGDLFGKSAWLLYHTLRIGGLAFVLIAAWLWTGHRPALLVDALVAGSVGVIFILTGTGMLIDGGDLLQVIINAFCGVVFFRAAMQSADLYRATRTSMPTMAETTSIHPVNTAASSPNRDPDAVKSPASPSEADVSSAPADGYLASFARKRNR